MKVTLVSTGLENPGIGALSAWLRAHGHTPVVVYEPRPFSTDSGPRSALLGRVFEPTPEATAARVLATAPDVVGFSTYTLTHPWAVQVARAVRSRRLIPTVFGGPHPTGAPAATLQDPAIDAAVVGEGEETLLELVESVAGDRFGRTDIDGAWFRGDAGPVANGPRPLIRDLDALPVVDREPFYDRVPEFEHDFMILTQRGCPFRCSYCEHSRFARRHPGEARVRRRTVDHVLAELRAWKARGRMRKVFFWDAIFARDPGWLRQFAPRYRTDIGLPFECYAHPRTVTPAIARLLHDAGCTLVRMGVQSVSPATLERLDRPAGPEHVRRAAGWLRDAGVPYAFDHILALPGEGAAEQRDAVRLYAELKPERVLVHWMTYLPGTAAFDEAVASGHLTADDAKRILAGGMPGFDAPHAAGLSDAEVAEMAQLGLLMDLIPILPGRLILWLLESGFHRRLGGGEIVRQLVAAGLAVTRNPALRERMRSFLALALREVLPRPRSTAARDLPSGSRRHGSA